MTKEMNAWVSVYSQNSTHLTLLLPPPRNQTGARALMAISMIALPGQVILSRKLWELGKQPAAWIPTVTEQLHSWGSSREQSKMTTTKTSKRINRTKPHQMILIERAYSTQSTLSLRNRKFKSKYISLPVRIFNKPLLSWVVKEDWAIRLSISVKEEQWSTQTVLKK